MRDARSLQLPRG